MSRNAHPTKAGPGRKHGNRVKHGKPPTQAGGEWAGLHTNPKRNAERKLVKAIGIRQVKKQRRAGVAA